MKKKNANSLTIEEHFAELKKRLFIAIGTLMILFGACLWKSNAILALFLKQGRDAGYRIIALTPQEVLLQQLKVSLTCGLLASVPVLLYEIAVFITPAMGKQHIKKMWVAITAGVLLFMTGAAFAIKLLFPLVLRYMKDITDASGIALEVTTENYISFFLTTVLMIGAVFEIPMASLVLSNLGLISPEKMKKYRKPVIILILIVAAVITPPDIVSQVMVALPMIALYEISIILCSIARHRKLKEA